MIHVMLGVPGLQIGDKRPAHARIVVNHIHAAQFLLDGVKHLCHRLGIHQIAAVGRRLSPIEAGKFLRDLLGALQALGQIHDGYIGARLSKRQGRVIADVARRTRNYSCLTVQSKAIQYIFLKFHVVSPLLLNQSARRRPRCRTPLPKSAAHPDSNL